MLQARIREARSADEQRQPTQGWRHETRARRVIAMQTKGVAPWWAAGQAAVQGTWDDVAIQGAGISGTLVPCGSLRSAHPVPALDHRPRVEQVQIRAESRQLAVKQRVITADHGLMVEHLRLVVGHHDPRRFTPLEAGCNGEAALFHIAPHEGRGHEQVDVSVMKQADGVGQAWGLFENEPRLCGLPEHAVGVGRGAVVVVGGKGDHEPLCIALHDAPSTCRGRSTPVKKPSLVIMTMTGLNSVQVERLSALKDEVDGGLEALLDDAAAAGGGQVVAMARHVLMSGGKRLRPVLFMLSYEAAGGVDRDHVMPLALAFELIHTATLVHDDMNDAADERRGRRTLHLEAGPEKALIAGDWLFVQGFGLGGRYPERVVRLMADCCADIAVSEFKQLDHIDDLTTSPEDYLDIVRGKTAGPFAAGCQSAALLAGCTEEEASAFRTFGEELGIAFQLVDDLLDLRGSPDMGKPRGVDVAEGKMTLPLIHALTLSHGADRTTLAELLASFTEDRWDELMALLGRSDSLHYVELLVDLHLERAANALLSAGSGPAADLMVGMLAEIGSRTR
ncbi:MAG: polyprenyl synthetase family protein [Candidatus Poseidoniales archaeon]|nr:MAG: polyprenyl synthetase family protein [Candidatus Poseidoniales archaeon]